MSVVLVNVFEVREGQEEQFLADWRHAAEWMRQQPGFLSSKAAPKARPGGGVPLHQRRRVAVRRPLPQSRRFPRVPAAHQRYERAAHPALYRVVIE
jgi:Antibiotic biosynthesis monooxygenase